MLCPLCGAEVGAAIQLCDECQKKFKEKDLDHDAENVAAQGTYQLRDPIEPTAGLILRLFAVLIDAALLLWLLAVLGKILEVAGGPSLNELVRLISSLLSTLAFRVDVATDLSSYNSAGMLIIHDLLPPLAIWTVFVFLLFLVGLFYCARLESSSYRATVGKLILRIHVENEDRKNLSFRQACLRHLAKGIWLLPLLLGLGVFNYLLTSNTNGLNAPYLYSLLLVLGSILILLALIVGLMTALLIVINEKDQGLHDILVKSLVYRTAPLKPYQAAGALLLAVLLPAFAPLPPLLADSGRALCLLVVNGKLASGGQPLSTGAPAKKQPDSPRGQVKKKSPSLSSYDLSRIPKRKRVFKGDSFPSVLAFWHADERILRLGFYRNALSREANERIRAAGNLRLLSEEQPELEISLHYQEGSATCAVDAEPYCEVSVRQFGGFTNIPCGKGASAETIWRAQAEVGCEWTEGKKLEGHTFGEVQTIEAGVELKKAIIDVAIWDVPFEAAVLVLKGAGSS